MTDPTTPKSVEPTEEGWPIFELWKEYEGITMHFNDLLMRLRTQALAAVAAIATIIGIFTKSGTDAHTTWEMVAFTLFTLTIFWIAIWVIDFCYYNRLLLGAVAALVSIEQQSKDKLYFRPIEMSSKIEDAVAGYLPKNSRACQLSFGRWFFYVLVFFALFGGFGFSLCQYLKS